MNDKYFVGQRVYLRDVNEKRIHSWIDGKPPTGEVVSVGRKLLKVKSGRFLDTYRIETGVKNDQWEHASIQTFEEFEAEAERGGLKSRLENAGLEFSLRRGKPIDNETLRKVVEILEER